MKYGTVCRQLTNSHSMTQDDRPIHGGIEAKTKRQNGRNFVNDILKCISVNGKGKVLHLIKISPKFVPEGPSNIKSSLF